MLFRRLIYCSILVGLIAGIANSAIQQLQVVPIIAEAEVFESMLPSETEVTTEHESGKEAHNHASWAPRDGVERNAWTVLSNVLSAIGFALLMIPVMVYWSRQRGGNVTTIKSGLIWGSAGWFCFYVWPSLGLSPELPGESAAGLPMRQVWWLLTVACAVIGLVLIAITKEKWRWLGVPILAIPFLIGAPHIDGSMFARHNADTITQLEHLKLRFIVATTISNFVHWLVLGVVSAMIIRRWLGSGLLDSGDEIKSILSSSRKRLNS